MTAEAAGTATDEQLTAVLAQLVRTSGLEPAGAVEPQIIGKRRPRLSGSDELVVRIGDIVVKAHAPDADPDQLLARLAVTEDPALAEVLLQPLAVTTDPDLAGRLVTMWPHGNPLSESDDPGRLPWSRAAELLARLHLVPPKPGLPAAGGPARVARAIGRLTAAVTAQADPAEDLLAAAETVLAAAAGLPTDGPATGLCHGDWHLGQLVELPDQGWRMIDIDDLGVGDQCWDLARPAAWFAAGLLDEPTWAEFLTAYLGAAGPALDRDEDPWLRLEVPARAVTVQAAALAVASALDTGAPIGEPGSTMVRSCALMPRLV